MSRRANVLTKYDVEYGWDFNAEKFLEAISDYEEVTEYESGLIYSQPSDGEESGLYEFNRPEFYDFVEWLKETSTDKLLIEFAEQIAASNPKDKDYVRVEIW